MDFGQVASAVRQLWDFVWPPVVILVVMSFLAWFVARTTASDTVDAVHRLATSVNVPSLRRSMKAWGLATVLPVVVAFAVIFTLYITKNLVSVTGRLIPPTVTFTPDNSIARHMGDAELLCIWQQYPLDLGLDSIRDLAIRQKRLPPSGTSYWSEQAGAYTEAFDTSKFMVIWAAAWFAVEWWRTKSLRAFARFAVSATCGLLIAFVFATLYLYAIEQNLFDDARDLRALVSPAGYCVDKQAQPLVATNAQIATIQRMRHDPWWNVRFEPSDYAAWTSREILGIGRH